MQRVRYEGCGMMRPEPAGEPSMEDILASIRKIIAEDPPGSRPDLGPRQQTAMPTANRPVMRDAEPGFQRAAPEPYLRQSPRQEPFPSYPAASVPEFSAAPANQPELPSPSRASIIDDQLSGLLAGETDAAPATKPVGSTTGPAPDFIAKMTARPVDADEPTGIPQTVAPETPAKLEARPGFTVSRDGFVPEAQPAAADPFEFNLGPSPFASRPAHLRQEHKASTAPQTRAHDFGSLVPTRHMEDVQVAPSEPAAPLVADSPAQAAPEVKPSSVTAVLESLEAAEVNGTHANVSLAQSPADVLADAADDASPHASSHDEIIVVAEPAIKTAGVEPPVLQAEFETVNQEIAAAEPAPSQALSTTHYRQSSQTLAPSERTMEDTVAELLRPMLKSWLAENMPKIVEKALRKEIAERNLIEHKDAAE